MNTTRIVVLTLAVGAGGVAAYRASRPDHKSLPTEPVARLPGETANAVRGVSGPAARP